MKLHFEPDLDYQLDAVDAVCDLFRGQEQGRSVFSVVREAAGDTAFLQGYAMDAGTGNRLTLLDEQVEANLREVQQRNGLPPSGPLAPGGYDFTVEMETGTGKTYVYLRTIFELHRRYGFSKFLIVVPSVAIKEGVFKTLQVTQEHFRGLYANVPYEFFLYDSGKLGQVRGFATSASIQIMVTTKSAIDKKDINTIYEPTEKLNDERPVTLIQQTRPIVIVDEPQSVDGGAEGRGREALKAMHPLCTLRYSATHVDKHHMVFSLNAVDAYQRRLVKQIEVASLHVEGDHNTAYVKLLKAGKKPKWVAKLELDVKELTGVRRVAKEVRVGDDLGVVTGRDLYANLVVEEMDTESVGLRGREHRLRVGESVGGVDADGLKRAMIRRTIQEHLEKELRLRSKGIKVLSLFFVDEVARYRTYAADGTPEKGRYAVIFEEEYAAAIKAPKYSTLFKDVDTATLPAEVHDGYFSQDKSGRLTESAEEGWGNQAGRENAERAYKLIMQDKERLLSFDTKLKFIFSHSALREGWDNPNVFQICVLRDMGTELARRQSIGRGLRLCVNQQGERLRGFEVNTLTVVASERYEDFAENLQREIEEDTGFRFGRVEPHAFGNIACPGADGSTSPLGFERSKELWDHLRGKGYVDARGKATDALRADLKAGTLALPAGFEAVRAQVQDVLRKLTGKLEVKNADGRERIKTREKVLHGEAFKALWDRIKHRTAYRLDFDQEKLVRDCAEALAKSPAVTGARVQIRKAELDIGKGGVTTTETATSAPVALSEPDIVLPDVVTALEEDVGLTRRSIVRILTESGRLADFKKNPQQFVAQAKAAIEHTRRLALVDGIRYRRVGDDAFYALELFEKEELRGYLADMLKDDREKCVYDHVPYQSDVERSFAEAMEKNEAVKVFAKLPGWFQIPTPLGTYNPDWAVLVEVDGAERVYFVVETKGSLYADALRAQERAKIDCGRAHFKALSLRESPVRYLPATTLDDVLGAAAEAR